MSESPVEWKKVTKKSEVWKYFLIRSDRKKLKCIQCKAIFNYASATTSFKYHLERLHGIKIEATAATSSSKSISMSVSQPSSSTVSISQSWVKNSRQRAQQVVARLACIDRISFKTIATSQDIRQGFAAQGLKISSSRTKIREMVIEFAYQLRDLMKSKLKDMIQDGKKFALTLDEWTSMRNLKDIFASTSITVT